MTDSKNKTIIFNWRWIKILLPLWIVFGGIPLLIMGRSNTTKTVIVLAIAFLAALAATAFCIKCFLLFLKENEKQKKDLEELQKDVQLLEKQRADKTRRP